MRHDDSESLCDQLYEAAFDTSLWQGALATYAQAFGGVGTVILEPGRASPILDVSSGLSEPMAAYNGGWWQHDLVALTAQRLNLSRPGIVWDDDFITSETKRKSFYFQDFLAKWGIGSVATTIARPAGGPVVAINVQRRLGMPPPEAPERERFADASRHLARALAVRMRLGRAEAIQTTLTHQLSSFDCAVAILDHSGLVLETNERFAALGGTGMNIRGRRIHLTAVAHQARLDAMLHAIAEGSGNGHPDTMAVPRPDSILPLLVRVVPLHGRSAERLCSRSPAHGALVLVLDPSHTAYPDLGRTLTLLGLTPAQARVAVLIGSGHSARSAAEALAVTEETIRSHLKAIFQRLGISRQSEIARLIARAAPFAAPASAERPQR